MMEEQLWLLAGCAIAFPAIAVGRWFRGKVHAAIQCDPGLVLAVIAALAAVIVAVAVPAVSVDVAATTTLLAVLAVVSYILGHQVGPGEKKLTLWEHEHADKGPNYIHEVKTYSIDKKIYLAPETFRTSFGVLFGARDTMDLDMSQSYLTTQIRVDDTIYFGIIPVAKSDPPKDCDPVRKLRIGNRKVKAADGKKTKEPRYLLTFAARTTKYYPAARLYQRPEAFMFDHQAHIKALEDAAVCRAQITRLELDMQTAKYDGVVDHVRDMCSLDVDNPVFAGSLDKMIAAERERRRKLMQPKPPLPSGTQPTLEDPDG